MAKLRRVFVLTMFYGERHERQAIQTFQTRRGWSSVEDGPAHGRPRAGWASDTPPLPRRSLTNLYYGFSLVAFSHTVGCAGHLAARISRHSGALLSACCVPTGSPTFGAYKAHGV